MGFGDISAGQDSRTGDLVAMGELHKRIHEGVLFTLDQDNESLADDASLEYLIVTDADQACHMRAHAACGGNMRVRINEAVTTSDDGSEATPINRNRLSSNTADTTIYTGATVTDYGTELGNQVIPGGSGFFARPGASAPIFQEFILKKNTKYTVRVTNIAGLATVSSLELQFYEHEWGDSNGG